MSKPKSPTQPAYRRVVHRPPWCPGHAVPHVCNCGVRTTYEPLTGPAALADRSLRARWHRGADPRAVAFWLGLLTGLSLRVAHALARDALAHGFTLSTLYTWCATHGFTW